MKIINTLVCLSLLGISCEEKGTSDPTRQGQDRSTGENEGLVESMLYGKWSYDSKTFNPPTDFLEFYEDNTFKYVSNNAGGGSLSGDWILLGGSRIKLTDSKRVIRVLENVRIVRQDFLGGRLEKEKLLFDAIKFNPYMAGERYRAN